MKKIKIGAIALFASVMLPSCTDLEEKAFDILPASEYYQDQKSVIATLLRPYEHGHWCAWDGDRWILQELTADQFMWAQKGKHGFDGGQWIRMHGHTWTPEDGVVNGGWAGPYQGIGQCNLCIRDFKVLDFKKLGMDEKLKDEYIAEMRVLRAWYYMFELDLFRSVPIVEEVGQVQPQSTPQEVFAYIEKELKESLPALKKEPALVRWGQAGAASVLVRLYLNAEAWTGTPRYADCAKVAQDIIDGVYGSQYKLDPDYRGPFKSGVNGYRSPENIFEFKHAKNTYEFGWMYDAMMHYQTRYSLNNDKGGWNGVSLTPSRDMQGNIYDYSLGKPYEKYPDGDLRKQPFTTTDIRGGYNGFFQVGPAYEFNAEQGFGYNKKVFISGTEEWKDLPLIFVDQCARFGDDTALKKAANETPENYKARMSDYLKTLKEKNGGWYHVATSQNDVISKGSQISTGEESTGIRLLKFPWLQMSAGLFMTNSAPEIRMAEIYYSLAECKFRAKDVPGAAVLLDAVRKRNYEAADWAAQSYVANPSKLTNEEFVDEWGREFLGEHRRRTDLVRWGRFGEEWWAKPKDAADKSVYPIPNRALNANPLLKTNGY